MITGTKQQEEIWSEIENADASEKQHFALSYAGLVMNNEILPPIRRKE